MRPYQTLIYQKKGQVGAITLNRSEVGNAIDMQLAREMADICSEINQDPEVRVVTLTAVGKVFSVGTDWKDFSAVSGRKLSERDLALWSVATPVSRINCPVIAGINGDALGQGLELALACDIRIAVETACLGLPQVTANLIPRDGGTQRLPRLVGRTKAMEMILLGEPVSAGEAYRLGLVNMVVTPEKLAPVLADTAQKMVAGAPLALLYAKEAVRQGLDMTLEQGLRLETDLYLMLQTTEDRIEGITSFREKRRPGFKGK